MDTDALLPSQRDALAQLQVLTNGGDQEVAMNVLESVNWDIQRAAEIIFDSHPPAPLSISSPSTTYPPPSTNEPFDLDESEQGLLTNETRRHPRRPQSSASSALSLLFRPLRLLLSILTFPFHILRAFFRLLRIPLPQLPYSLSSLTLYYSRPRSTGDLRMDAKSVIERWVQSLEEETGVMCASKARAIGSSTAVEEPSTSMNLTIRKGVGERERILPDFFLGGYEEFVRACARESDAKIGCVILVSEEHDDVAEFKRSTLTDPKFVNCLLENNFLVWGGDIRDREAWSAAQKLEATTYPFVAFIALQPRRGPATRTGAPSSPSLTILSRHQGPSIPSATAPTSATTLLNHLDTNLLPRIQPFLARVKTQAQERENMKALENAQRDKERQLRAEQDRAFEEAKRRDKERIEASIAERKRLREETRAQEEKKKREEEEAEKEEAAKQAWDSKRMEWRRWSRRHLLPREPRPALPEPSRGKTIRIGVRMPNGKRAVRFFGEGDSVTAVYTFVDTLFIPYSNSSPTSSPLPGSSEWSSDLDPTSPPDGSPLGEEGLVQAMQKYGRVGGDWWRFKLASSYPRREISWEAARKIGEVEGLKGGGQLVAEVVESSKAKSSSNGKGKEKAQSVDDEYDGYDTEESE